LVAIEMDMPLSHIKTARRSARIEQTLRLGNFRHVIRECRHCYDIAAGITGRTMSSGPSGTATAAVDQPQIDSITRPGSL